LNSGIAPIREELMAEDQGGLKARGEEAIGEVAQALLENPLFSQALGRALGAGERAMQVQKSALGAIDVASAGDVERVSRRVRSLADRLEAVEDAFDELRDELKALRREVAEASGPPAAAETTKPAKPAAGTASA
jgi:chromosome segregation ATPase